MILERAENVGKKILVSGGRRCNFTNLNTSTENFISENAHFCKSALARFTPRDFIALIEKYSIPYHEKKLGQLFCDKSSQDIIGLLKSECSLAGAEIQLNCEAERIKKNDFFVVHTNRGIFEAQSLVIAAGGLSMPKIGATAFGYQVAKQFGLQVVPCRPALVPLTWNRTDGECFRELAGISLDAVVRCGREEFREQILFTHKGLSGPAILQISSYWKPDAPIFVDLLPGEDILRELIEGRNKNMDVRETLAGRFPRRFVQKWIDHISAKPLMKHSNAELKRISGSLHKWEIFPAGTEGYDKAEVTAGGVSIREISSKTMEAGKVPGLFFVGEVMDVTGHLGGYNLQWAWSSGFAAGQFV